MWLRLVLSIIVFLQSCKICNAGLAGTKCKEYSKAVYVEKDSPVLSVAPKKDVETDCRIASVPLIIGGTAATEEEFPHTVVIGFGQSPSSELHWDCGGSLISELYVLTAAHCCESRELGPAQKVQLGIINLGQSDGIQEKNVEKRIPHPDFKSSTKENDIALLKLDSSVEFTPSIRPACLHTEPLKNGRKVLATGFGKLNYDDEKGSTQLMKVALTIYENSECSKDLKKEMFESTLCAGQLSGGKDTCQGDSGGPLQTVLEDPYCMYSILGVTSYGRFCGFPNTPSVYTRVSSFVSWIEDIVWK